MGPVQGQVRAQAAESEVRVEALTQRRSVDPRDLLIAAPNRASWRACSSSISIASMASVRSGVTNRPLKCIACPPQASAASLTRLRETSDVCGCSLCAAGGCSRGSASKFLSNSSQSMFNNNERLRFSSIHSRSCIPPHTVSPLVLVQAPEKQVVCSM